MPEPTWTKTPKPWAEMTRFEREAWEWEVQADLLQDEMPYMSPNEIAAGLMADTAEFGDAASFRLAAVLRKRASASSLGIGAKAPLAAPPTGPKPPPLRGRPTKLSQAAESTTLKLL